MSNLPWQVRHSIRKCHDSGYTLEANAQRHRVTIEQVSRLVDESVKRVPDYRCRGCGLKVIYRPCRECAARAKQEQKLSEARGA